MSYARTYVLDYAEPSRGRERLACYDIRPDGEQAATVHVVGSSARRLIAKDAVQQVSDIDTGELLSSIEQAYGGPPALSENDIKAARSKDKSLWDKPFLLRVIENHYRNKLFGL